MDKDLILTDLINRRIWDKKQPLKLHLGCGTKKLNGYVNIDFPSDKHTVQQESGADYYTDILNLVFPPSCIDEIKLHHVFEHFSRPTALAQLCLYQIWLKNKGLLTIETPDFKASLRLIQFPFYTFSKKQVVLRHLFGSQEAEWAVHQDGWYKDKFRKYLHALGFEIINFKYSKWKMTRNITVKARKEVTLDINKLRLISINLMKDSLLDNSESETRLLQVWNQNFEKSLNLK